MLYYLVGPSGVGKDSVLETIEQRNTNKKGALLVADRYITRPSRPGDENHIEITVESFIDKRDSNLFLFNWESHDFHYGIGKEVLQWKTSGHRVIINGSRAYIPNALSIYPQLHIIWLSVSEVKLRERLINRGRETEAEIAARIERSIAMEKTKPANCKTIFNDGTLENTVNQVLTWINQQE